MRRPYELCFGHYLAEFGDGSLPVLTVFVGDVESVGVGDPGRFGGGVVKGPKAGDGVFDLVGGDSAGHLVRGFCHHGGSCGDRGRWRSGRAGGRAVTICLTRW